MTSTFLSLIKETAFDELIESSKLSSVEHIGKSPREPKKPSKFQRTKLTDETQYFKPEN